MIRITAALLTVLFTAPSAGALCYPSVIHLTTGRNDPEWYLCSEDVIPGETLTLDVVIALEYPFDRLAVAEFRILDWPEDPDPAQGLIVESWFSDTAAGNLRDGIALTWETPLERLGDGEYMGLFHLGTVQLSSFDPTWLADELQVEFDHQNCLFVNDWGESLDVWPGMFLFNGGTAGWCTTWIADPPDFHYAFARHFLPGNGNTVPREFTLEFEAYGTACLGLGSFVSVFVTLNDTPIMNEVFFSYGPWVAEQISLPVFVSDVEIGAPVHLRIEIGHDDEHEIDEVYEFTYILDDTPVQPTNLSVVKSLY